MTLTIFTPTFNRLALLQKLYESLRKQTDLNFEWLIYDDCSTDGTEAYIKSLQDSPFIIKYRKSTKNLGKHGVYNLALEELDKDLFLCVDSDDVLSENAVKVIYETVKEAKSVSRCVGYIFPQLQNEIKNYSWKKIDGKLIDIIDMVNVYKIKETAIVFKSKYLKSCRFGTDTLSEKFCAENVLYNQLVEKGKFYAKNKEFYCAEYQVDGLTKNIRSLWFNNPNNYIKGLESDYYIYKKYCFFRRIRLRFENIVRYNAFCIRCRLGLFYHNYAMFPSIILLLPGWLFSLTRYWRI